MDSTGVECVGEYVGRLSYGSDAIKELKEFAERNGIASGVFTIIGAVKSATLAFYYQERKNYVKKKYATPMEIVSCYGNITDKDGVKLVHAHGSFVRKDGSVVGGHIVSMDVFAGEFHLRAFSNRIERRVDEQTGLNLLELQTLE
jgi:predicted DNA-binding protein with PD1-like motif